MKIQAAYVYMINKIQKSTKTNTVIKQNLVNLVEMIRLADANGDHHIHSHWTKELATAESTLSEEEVSHQLKRILGRFVIAMQSRTQEMTQTVKDTTMDNDLDALTCFFELKAPVGPETRRATTVNKWETHGLTYVVRVDPHYNPQARERLLKALMSGVNKKAPYWRATYLRDWRGLLGVKIQKKG